MYLLMPEILRHLLFKFLLLVGLFCIAVRYLLFHISFLSVVFVKRNVPVFVGPS